MEYSSHHHLTNLRAFICKGGSSERNVLKQHFQEASQDLFDPKYLLAANGRVVYDAQNDSISRQIFNHEVAKKLLELGHEESSRFVTVIVEGVIEAEDQRGLSAVARIKRRLSLLEWLEEGVDYSRFYGAYVRGIPWKLYECLATRVVVIIRLYSRLTGRPNKKFNY